MSLLTNTKCASSTIESAYKTVKQPHLHGELAILLHEDLYT